MSQRIYIMVCDDIPGNVVSRLVPIINDTFGIETVVIEKNIDMEAAYDKKRKQYFAPAILDMIEKDLPKDCIRALALIDKDIYAKGLNFIFGQARGKVCLVSINRFKPCTWIDTEEELEILFQRVLKTSIHELGHTFGLEHCKDYKCVMFFSNWIGDTDRKSYRFCKKCLVKLQKVFIKTR